MGDPRDRTPAWDLLAVLFVKAVVGAAVLRAGFVALSDDDFSRVVIAERFAAGPSLDPSGTSWLPLPFWIAGSTMAAFGRSLVVARGTAVLLGLLSALLVHRAARWVGASRAGALLGALFATTIPTAARLGVSFQPEALTAGLVVLGAASTCLDDSRRVWGALALAAACLCRYEAWPVAAVFAALCAADSVRGQRDGRLASAVVERDGRARALVAASLVAVAAPLAWVIHGALAHGDAWFFVHRVAAYRNALGVTETWGASVAAYPVMLVSAEPELTLGALALIGVAARIDRAFLASLARPALLLASVLAFLIVGRLLDGAPTHHAERTLLPLWTGLAVAGAETLLRLVTDPRAGATSGGPRAWVAVPLVACAAGAVMRSGRPAESFPARAAERSIGAVARAMLTPGARLLVDTADYGYFAVIAAFGAPERAEPFDRHDPRDPKTPDAFSTPEALPARVRASGATALVVRREHWPAALAVGRLLATRSDFLLVDTTSPPRSLMKLP